MINESQFQQLTDCCDRLLNSPDATSARVAIPWLHVLHGHPAQCAKYESVFERAAGNRWAGVRRVLGQTAANIRGKFRADKHERQLWDANGPLPSSATILLITHRVSTQHDGLAEDFYFGNVPQQLAARGNEVVIAAIDHTGGQQGRMCDRKRDGGVTQVRFATSLTRGDEFRFQGQMKEASAQLENEARGLSGLSHRVAKEAAKEVKGEGTQSALRIGYQVRELVAKIQPRNLLLIHEGHAWERLAFRRAREARPEIRCLGYHHAVLFPWHHALMRNLAPEYNPDSILTAGENSRDALRDAVGLGKTPVDVLGTNKAEIKPDGEIQSKEPVCLVVPEGIPQECRVLFEFALNCARAMPMWKFVFRSHPVMPLANLSSEINGLKEPPANVNLSVNTIEEDFLGSRWVLYRGSGAVIQAVMAGLKPLYYALPGELNFDPLHQFKSWRDTISSIEEFQSAAQADLSASEQQRQQDGMTAKDDCRQIFRKLDVSALENVLAS